MEQLKLSRAILGGTMHPLMLDIFAGNILLTQLTRKLPAQHISPIAKTVFVLSHQNLASRVEFTPCMIGQCMIDGRTHIATFIQALRALPNPPQASQQQIIDGWLEKTPINYSGYKVLTPDEKYAASFLVMLNQHKQGIMNKLSQTTQRSKL